MRFAPLARTDLAGVELVPLPDGWRTPATARSAFRETWCGRQGLDLSVCGPPAPRNGDTPAPVAADREAWCAGHTLLPEACSSHFSGLEDSFTAAWDEERTSSRDNLPKLGLRERDLRRALAFGTSLVGADLAGAQLEGADLGGAQMVGANLSYAQMDGADLGGAQIEGANLSHARMRARTSATRSCRGRTSVGRRWRGPT